MIVPLWFVLALGASVCWGINYAVTEKLLHNNVSVFFLGTASSLMFLCVSWGAALWNGSFKSSLAAFQSGQVPVYVFVFYMMSSIAGWFMVNKAIALNNSTTVSILEIIYPLFTIFFTWVFFHTVHLNGTTALGGGLIMAGVILILLQG